MLALLPLGHGLELVNVPVRAVRLAKVFHVTC
jgi:hypothetical protein